MINFIRKNPRHPQFYAILIKGKKGYGKTYLAYQLALHFFSCNRIILFGFNGDQKPNLNNLLSNSLNESLELTLTDINYIKDGDIVIVDKGLLSGKMIEIEDYSKKLNVLQSLGIKLFIIGYDCNETSFDMVIDLRSSLRNIKL